MTARDGRAGRRLTNMRRVQAVALDLFDARGFDGVTIEDVARAAEVGPATVYRAFGTKEGIVLWDEYDPALLAAFARELASRPPAAALLAAVIGSLADVYDRDAERIRRRALLIRHTPAIGRAASADLVALREAVAGVLTAERRARDPLEARVFAGALVATLEAALDHWLDRDGAAPLSRCLRLAFARLGKLLDLKGSTGR